MPIASAGATTSSYVPRLPSTTAAFRLSPVTFGRFIAERLNAARNSSSLTARITAASVFASFPAIADRGRNAGACTSRANLRLNGHT